MASRLLEYCGVLKYCTVELRRSIVYVTQCRVWDWNQCTEMAN